MLKGHDCCGLSAIGRIFYLCHASPNYSSTPCTDCTDYTDDCTDPNTHDQRNDHINNDYDHHHAYCELDQDNSNSNISNNNNSRSNKRNSSGRSYSSASLSHSPSNDHTWSTYSPIALLIATCLAFELSSILIMTVISSFYLSITSQDMSAFLSSLWRAVLVVTLVSVCQSGKTFAVDITALQWRTRLVTMLHCHLNTSPAWTLVVATQIENIDQRMTQDVYRLTLKLATLLGTTLTLPFIIVFYTYYLIILFGPIAPLACFIYFIIGAALTHMQARKIIPLVYNQEAQEGYFRSRHVHFKQYQESIMFLRGGETEVSLLDEAFQALRRSVQRLIYTQLSLNLIVNWFSYFGSIGMRHVACYVDIVDGVVGDVIIVIVIVISFLCLYCCCCCYVLL